MPFVHELEIRQGQVKVVYLLITNEDGTPYNLTTTRIFATVREHPNGETIINTRDSDVAGQIDILDAAGGYARIKWVKADSADLRQRTYSWDVWLFTDQGPIPWLAPSAWKVLPGVTKPVQMP